MIMINKVFDYFGFDGLKHVIASNLVVVIANLFFPLWLAVIIAAAIGVGKEVVWDKMLKKGTFSKKDLLADFAGIVMGSI